MGMLITSCIIMCSTSLYSTLIYGNLITPCLIKCSTPLYSKLCKHWVTTRYWLNSNHTLSKIWLVIFRTDLNIFRKNQAISKQNPAIFRTHSALLGTNPAIVRTNQVLIKKYPVMYLINGFILVKLIKSGTVN